jgi:hypothetical protein
MIAYRLSIIMNRSLNVRERLLSAYQEAGLEVYTGKLHCVRDNPPQMTGLKNGGRMLETGGAGVSWNEIPCFEMLGQCLQPASVLVIGNSWGWSTLLMSMLWPEATVVAMDTGYEVPTRFAHKAFDNIIGLIRGAECYREYGNYGIDLTNKLVQKHNLNAKVIRSMSPKDTQSVVRSHLKTPPEFIFIDGQHTTAQVLLDFNGCREVASPDCVYLFHDIISWDLIQAFEACKTSGKLSGGLLWRTASGMGLLFPSTRPDV